MIKTYLAPSAVSGIGLFSGENIPKGKIIWEYFPLVDITFSVPQWEELRDNIANTSFDMIQRYAYKEEDHYVLCTDNAQFMNHCSNLFNVTNTDDLKSMFTLREIKKGEELLCNYMEYSDPDDHHRIYLESLEKSS